MRNTRKKVGSAGPMKSRDAGPRSRRGGKKRRAQEELVQEQEAGVGGSESTMAQAADDDVSIDSDDAFDAEDEARYGEVLRRIQQNESRSKKRRRPVSHEDDAGSDEAEEEVGEYDDEGDLGDGEMLLSDMLGAAADNAERVQDGGGTKAAKGKPLYVDEGEEEEVEDDEVEEDDEEDDDDEEEQEDDDDDEDEDVDHAGLMDMIDQLAAAQGNSRSSHGGAGDGVSGPDPLQAMSDSAFGTRAADGLTMEAMLDALKGTKGYAAVRKRLSQLGDKAVVAAPSAGVVQDRAQRQVVYEVKKKDAADWLPLVSAARRAESLNFSNTELIHPSQAALVEKFRPETEMELAIRDLLTHAKADEEAQVEKREEEELGARGLSLAEVKARHAELAKMRALLFYEQQKRHRANKIKSKAYHRIRKRQRLRAEEAENDALRDADPDAARELDEKEARARAEERMSLRHKNTSKWAKHVLRHGAHAQVDTRKAIAEQLQMGEDLRKKAELGSDDEEDDDDDGDVEEGDEERAARARRAAVGRLRGLLGEVEGEEKGQEEEKGIMGMKFMKRTIEKQRQRAKEEVAKVLRDLEAEEEEEEDGGSAADGAAEADSRNGGSQPQSAEKQGEVSSNGKAPLPDGAMQTAAVTWGGQARMRVSGPMSISGGGDSAPADESESMAVVEEDDDDVDDVLAARMPVVLPETHAKSRGKSSAPLSAEDASSMSTTNAALRPVAAGAEAGGDSAVNPWLLPTTSARASEGKKRRGASGSGRGLLDVSAAVESVVKGRHQGAELQQQGSQAGERKQGQPKDRKEPRFDGRFDDDDEEAEDGGAGAGVIFGRKQEELVRRAFASVDVEADFAKEKEAAVEEEAAKEDKNSKKGSGSSAVPGWGSWAGIGAPPPPPPSTKGKGRGKGKSESQPRMGQTKKQAEEEDLGTVEQGAIQKLGDKRKDKYLPTVIISQKRIKAAAKLKLTEVPYPFTSVEQYERSLRRPLGKEWNTSLSVRDSVRPPVRVRPGTLVEPLKLGKRHPAVYYDKRAEQGKGKEEEVPKSKGRKGNGR